jgi:heme-degrading monooxygenase HmoA
MIARVWKCIAISNHVADYIEHFEHSVSAELNMIDGYEGAYILRRNVNNNIELTVMTLWESMDVIRKFAGDNVELAVVAPRAQEVLETFDSTVTHYEIILDAQPKHS